VGPLREADGAALTSRKLGDRLRDVMGWKKRLACRGRRGGAW